MITLATEDGRPTDNEQTIKATIASALQLRTDIDRFIRTWPPEMAAGANDRTPWFTWAALERQLLELSATPAQAAMVPDLVSATRKQARFKPPEMVLREVLCLAGVLMDETFRPSPDGEGEMS